MFDFQSLGYAFLFQFLSAWLAPKPKVQNAERYSLDKFNIPTASEDRALPWGVGTYQVSGNVVHYGDYAANEVTEKIRQLFSSQKQVVGYRYRIGMWQTLSVLPVDNVLEVWYGDDKVYSGTTALSKSAVTEIPVTFEKFTAEGQKVPDGLVGVLRFFNQKKTEGVQFTPLANDYMAAQLKKPKVPAYPNVCHVVFVGPSGYANYTGAGVEGGITSDKLGMLRDRGGFVSSGPSIQAMKFTLKRLPDISTAFPTGRRITYPVAGKVGEGSVWTELNSFIAANSDIEGDANPAFALLELLTTRVTGIGPKLSSWTLDVDSFLRAAEVLKREGNGVSFTWETSKPLSELMADVLKQIRGYLQPNRETGQLSLRLLRQTDAIAATFDDTNIVRITSCERVQLDEAPNEVRVKYTDRTADWVERTQPEKNEAAIKAAGAVISQEANYIGVSRPALASLLGTRDVLSLSSSVLQATWSGFLPIGQVLLPGDRVSFTHSELGQTVVMRITSARFGELNSGRHIEIEAVEDVFQDGYIGSFMSLSKSTAVMETPAQPGDYQSLGPVPFGFHRDGQYDRALWYVTRNSSKPASQAAYNLMVWDAEPLTEATGAYTDLFAHEFAAKGTMSVTIPRGTAKPSVAIGVDSGSAYTIAKNGAVQCVAYVGGRELALVSVSIAGASSTTAVVTFIGRGIYGTDVHEHLAGAPIVLLYGYAVDPTPVNIDEYGQVLTARAGKPSIQGPGGRLTPDYVNTPFHQVWKLRQGDYWTTYAGMPYAPANVRLDGVMGGNTPGSAATFTGTPAWLDWGHRNRSAQGYSNYFEGDAVPEVGVEYRVHVAWRTSKYGSWSGGNGVNVGSATNYQMPTLPATGYLELELTVYSVLNGKSNGIRSTHIRTA